MPQALAVRIWTSFTSHVLLYPAYEFTVKEETVRQTTVEERTALEVTAVQEGRGLHA